MNDKQAGDVKRYRCDHAVEVYEHVDGEWVRYSSIAHLLKPQEPGEDVEAIRKRWPKDHYEHNQILMADRSMHLERIEKLEAENKRLREYLETDELIAELQANETIKASQDSFVEGANYILKRWIEINNEALNSGGL